MPCKLSPPPQSGPEATVPPSVTLPPPVTLPPRASVYGSRSGSTARYSIGPQGSNCTALEGADSSFRVLLAGPDPSTAAVSYAYSEGGVVFSLDEACPYIPAVAAEVNASPGGPPAGGCAPGTGEVVRQIPTGKPHLWAAIIVDPPGTDTPLTEFASSPSDGTRPPPSTEEAVSVMVASDQEGLTQVGTCALPATQWEVCAAGLDYFLTQTIAAQAGPATVAAMQADIDHTGGVQTGTDIGHESDGEGQDKGCHAAVDAAMDLQFAESAGQPIAIPDDIINLPKLSGQVAVSYIPGDVTVCDSGLTPILNTPGGWDAGIMSLSAAIPGSGNRGPFVYSAYSTEWTSTPGAPAGQQLKTKFEPAKAKMTVDASLNIAFSGTTGTIEPAFEIAHASIPAAPLQDMTLIGPPGPLLEVGQAPTLEVSVNVTKQKIDDEVEQQESEGSDPETAEADVADETGGDAIIGIDEAASGFYGFNLPVQATRQLARQLTGALQNALGADQDLAAFTPAAENPVTSDITPEDAVAADAETGSGVDVGGSGLLELILAALAG